LQDYIDSKVYIRQVAAALLLVLFAELSGDDVLSPPPEPPSLLPPEDVPPESFPFAGLVSEPPVVEPEPELLLEEPLFLLSFT